MGGLQYTDTYSQTPTAASVKMLLAIAAAQDLGLRHLDFERAFLQTDVDDKNYVEFPARYQAFPIAARKLNKAIYRLFHAERCRNTKLAVDLQGRGSTIFNLNCVYSNE